MSIKQWYTVLLEDKVTMNTAHANWETRLEIKVGIKHMMRTEIETKVSMQRKTKFSRTADMINELLEILD